MRAPTHGCQNHNHRIFRVRKDPKNSFVLTPLPWAGIPSAGPGCWKLCPASTWTLPGLGYPQLLWTTCANVSSCCASTWARCCCVGREIPWCRHPAQQLEVLLHWWSGWQWGVLSREGSLTAAKAPLPSILMEVVTSLLSLQVFQHCLSSFPSAPQTSGFQQAESLTGNDFL